MMIVDAHVQDGAPKRVDLAQPRARYDPCAYARPESPDMQECTLVLYGVCANGNSVSLEVHGWRPWLRLEVPDSWNASDTEQLRAHFAARLRIPVAHIDVETSRLKRLCGWKPDAHDPASTRKFSFLCIRFPRLSHVRALTRDLKAGALNPPAALKSTEWPLVDTQLHPRSAALNDLGLCFSGWLTATATLRAACDGHASHCQLEFTCDASDVSSLDRDIIAPLVLASFDCEMFSHDGTFPAVGKGDFTYCICTSFRVQGSAAPPKRVAIFVGTLRAPEDSDLIVHCVATPAELLTAWRNLIVHADPDVLLSWNGKGFDMPFLAQEHAQARLEPTQRGTEGFLAALCRKAHELLGTWTERLTLPLVSALTAEVTRSDVLTCVRSVEASFDPQKPSIVRALLAAKSSARDAGGQSKLLFLREDEEASDEEDEEQGAVQVGAPPWVGPLLKQGSLLESIAHKARAVLLRNLVCCAEPPQTLAKVLPLLSAPQSAALWSWANEALGPGVCAMLRAPTVCDPMDVNLGMMLSRDATEVCVLHERQMTTAAKGDNLFWTIPMRGRAVVDLMQIVKDDKKPDSNALSYAAKKWLGGPEHDKIDMPVADIFALYAKSLQGDVSAAWPVVDYCARDADIPLWLCDKLMYLPTWIEQSRVCYTALDAVCNGGQQMKVFNLIARFVRGEFAINPPDSGWPAQDDAEDLGAEEPSLDRLRKKPSDYVGATVIPPLAGFYEDPISTLDFASLYPSIIINFNLCPSTLFRGSLAELQALQAASPAITYDAHVIKHNLPDPARRGEYKEEERTYLFLTHVPSLLSRLLLHLLNTRKAVKKLLAQATDPALKAVLKGRELGLKLCANSAYGFMGVSAKKGMLPCKPVAAVTTLKGRDMIEATRRYVEAHFAPARVVYGDTDSVMIHWGKGVSLQQAFALGERAAEEVTAQMRSGHMEGVGGAGALVAGAFVSAPTASSSAAPASSAKRPSPQRNASAAAAVVKLEHEKEYWPYLLFKKKNYAGIKHTPSGKTAEDGSILFHEETDIKGIDAVRRDRSLLLRSLSMDILNALLRERSVDSALGLLKARLEDIAERRVPPESFVLSKQIKSYYATESVVHAAAWRRMKERGDEGLPPVGARMPFLITLGPKDSKLYLRAEHPAHVARMNLPIDYGHYILSLKNATVKLLQFSSTAVEGIFKGALDKAHLKALGIGSLSSFFAAGAAAGAAAGNSSSSDAVEQWRSFAKERLREPQRAPPAKRAKKVAAAAPAGPSKSLMDYFSK
jgi:DNA polymerase elongation subunit (family B)